MNFIRKSPLAAFFIGTFTLTYGLGILGLTFPQLLAPPIFKPLFFIGAYAPSIVGFVLIGLLEGRNGYQQLWSRIIDTKMNLLWYFCILAYFIVPLFISQWVVDGDVLWRQDPWYMFLPIMLASIFTEDPGPIGEEIAGWRAFALPRLMQKYSAATSAIILGAVWGIWHLPAFFMMEEYFQWINLPTFILQNIAISVFMTWAMLKTKRMSIFLAIFMHACANQIPLNVFKTTQSGYFAGLATDTYLISIAVMLIALCGWDLKKIRM